MSEEIMLTIGEKPLRVYSGIKLSWFDPEDGYKEKIQVVVDEDIVKGGVNRICPFIYQLYSCPNSTCARNIGRLYLENQHLDFSVLHNNTGSKCSNCGSQNIVGYTNGLITLKKCSECGQVTLLEEE